MKLKNLLNLSVLGLALTITATGCHTHPVGVTPIREPRPNPSDSMIDSGAKLPLNDGGLGSDSRNSRTGTPITKDLSNWTPVPGEPLKSETIHFDFDKSAIKTVDQPKLEDIASYLKSHPDEAVRIEGNCDERGTEEYNRALGEHRALAAREYLTKLGIDPDKIGTISYGQDRPVETGRNESAYAKNRRDDFVAIMPPKP